MKGIQCTRISLRVVSSETYDDALYGLALFCSVIFATLMTFSYGAMHRNKPQITYSIFKELSRFPQSLTVTQRSRRIGI